METKMGDLRPNQDTPKQKSLVLYLDQLDVLDELTNEQRGQLFTAVRDFAKGDPVNLDGLLKAVFVQFKNQIKRDQEKYQQICERNKENINKRWNTKNTTGKTGIRKHTKNTHNDNDNKSDIRINKEVIEDKDNKGGVGGNSSLFSLFYAAYPRKTNKVAAEKAFQKLKVTQEFLQDTILPAIEQQQQSKQWQESNGAYIPHPATWLNQQRWEDELPRHQMSWDERFARDEQKYNQLLAETNKAEAEVEKLYDEDIAGLEKYCVDNNLNEDQSIDKLHEIMGIRDKRINEANKPFAEYIIPYRKQLAFEVETDLALRKYIRNKITHNDTPFWDYIWDKIYSINECKGKW
jgi:hypothetical protein